MEAQGQLGLQGQLLQFIGNSFALGAGGRRQGQEHGFVIIFTSPSSVQPIHSNDGRGQAHHTGEIHLGFRDGNLEIGEENSKFRWYNEETELLSIYGIPMFEVMEQHTINMLKNLRQHLST